MGRLGKFALAGLGVFAVIFAYDVATHEPKPRDCSVERQAFQAAEKHLKGELYAPGSYERRLLIFPPEPAEGTVEVSLLYVAKGVTGTLAEHHAIFSVAKDCSVRRMV